MALSTDEKRREFARITSLSVAQARNAQDQARIAAVGAHNAALKQYRAEDYSGGRDRPTKVHLEEGARAFREGEAAKDEKTKRSWYARAYLEYKDAEASAREDNIAGDAYDQAGRAVIEGAREVVSDAAKAAAGPLLLLAVAFAVAYGLSKGRR